MRILFHLLSQVKNACSFTTSTVASAWNCRVPRRGLWNSLVGRRYSTVNMASSTQITSPVFRSVFTPELQKLADIFKESGFEIRIAGGAVRDILMNIRPVDIDFATTATPTEIKKILEAKQIRMINAGGEKHGTVTARIDDKENFEVTTLRIDKTTDGRWAEVEFTTDWVLDASRRDLTINSMFLDLDGNLFDYFNGMDDLNNKRIRFVGNPDKRIQEDYLRILRYFRFYGRICPDPDNHCPETLESIRRNADGLKRISGERIWMELRKIVVGPSADVVMSRMIDLGLAPYMGLPEKPNVEEIKLVWKRCEDFNPKPMTILSALLSSPDEVEALDERVKLSNEECGLGIFIIRHRNNRDLTDYCKSQTNGDPLTPYQHLFAEEILNTKVSEAIMRCVELLKYRGDSVLMNRLSSWEMPKFPIHGAMFLEKGIRGPKVGLAINQLRHIWILSDFQKTADDLMQNELPKILEILAQQPVKRSDSKKRKKGCE